LGLFMFLDLGGRWFLAVRIGAITSGL
jgi:hypothetical protein